MQRVLKRGNNTMLPATLDTLRFDGSGHPFADGRYRG